MGVYSIEKEQDISFVIPLFTAVQKKATVNMIPVSPLRVRLRIELLMPSTAAMQAEP